MVVGGGAGIVVGRAGVVAGVGATVTGGGKTLGDDMMCIWVYMCDRGEGGKEESCATTEEKRRKGCGMSLLALGCKYTIALRMCGLFFFVDDNDVVREGGYSKEGRRRRMKVEKRKKERKEREKQRRPAKCANTGSGSENQKNKKMVVATCGSQKEKERRQRQTKQAEEPL